MLAGYITAQTLVTFIYVIVIINALGFILVDTWNNKIDRDGMSIFLGGFSFILITGVFAIISLALWGVL